MYRGLVLLFALVASTNGKVVPVPEQFSGRISGGVDATIESVPYQVEIVIPKGHHCGGSILSPRVVITAAHCVKNSSETYSVWYGSNEILKGKNVKIARIDLHEGYNEKPDENDIAIIHLAEDIEFGLNAKPIALANKSPAPGADGIVSGWGSSRKDPRPKILQKVNVQIIDHAVCKKLYKKITSNIPDKNICAMGNDGVKNICKGDSGGPLVVNNELVGTVKGGVPDETRCNWLGLPGYFIDISHHRQWIDSKIKQD